MPRAVKEPAKHWSEPEIVKALRKRYEPPRYGLLTNVSCGVGKMQRYCDSLAMSLFPSRGLDLTGFEIKSVRSDWLREIKQPAKADAVFNYCNFWYLVAANDEICKDGELPPVWGLLVMNDAGQLREKVKAPRLTPRALDASFMAAVFRRATEQGADARAISEARAEGYKAGENVGTARLQLATDRATELQKKIYDFESASGITLTGWTHPRELGAAVARALNGTEKDVTQRLERMRNVAQGIVEKLDAELGTEQPTQQEV